MNGLYRYLIEASFCILVFYLPYVAVLKRNTFFGLNRAYLLMAMLCSVLFPVLHIDLAPVTMVPGIFQIMVEPVTISGDLGTAAANPFNKQLLFLMLYISGTIMFALFFLYKLIAVIRLTWRTGVERINDIKFVLVEKTYAPASFFRYVFISENDKKEEILAHESAHIRYGHSWDVLLSELAIIFFWFNPMVWIYRNALREIHEYQADEATLKNGVDLGHYQNLVFEHCFGVKMPGMVIHFNSSPIKKRLIMMTKNKDRNYKKWLYLFVMPLFALAFLYISCENAKAGIVSIEDNKLEVIASNDVQSPPPPPPSTTEKAKEEAPPPPPPPPPPSVKEKVDTIPEDVPFQFVEDMPGFKGGGLEAFRDYIQSKVVYPQEAQDKGIQGRVTVQFVVNREGDVENVKILRSVDPLIDNEVIKAVKAAPKWVPGKQRGKAVKIIFSMPVNFKLKK